MTRVNCGLLQGFRDIYRLFSERARGAPLALSTAVFPLDSGPMRRLSIVCRPERDAAAPCRIGRCRDAPRRSPGATLELINASLSCRIVCRLCRRSSLASAVNKEQ